MRRRNRTRSTSLCQAKALVWIAELQHDEQARFRGAPGSRQPDSTFIREHLVVRGRRGPGRTDPAAVCNLARSRCPPTPTSSARPTSPAPTRSSSGPTPHPDQTAPEDNRAGSATPSRWTAPLAERHRDQRWTIASHEFARPGASIRLVGATPGFRNQIIIVSQTAVIKSLSPSAIAARRVQRRRDRGHRDRVLLSTSSTLSIFPIGSLGVESARAPDLTRPARDRSPNMSPDRDALPQLTDGG